MGYHTMLQEISKEIEVVSTNAQVTLKKASNTEMLSVKHLKQEHNEKTQDILADQETYIAETLEDTNLEQQGDIIDLEARLS